MRHLGLFLMGSLALSACASNSTPPAASSSTVAQATNEPNHGPDFAPAASDGVATSRPEQRLTGTNQTAYDGTSTNANHGATTQPAPSLAPVREGTADQRDSAFNGTGNAAATPTDRSTSTTDRSTSTNTNTNADADNSGVNKRDRNSAALTPMDQGSSASDRKLTQQIRQELMKDKSLSFTAKNVKIITVDGKVTLRGPVKSEAERSAIEAAARRATGDGARVDSQLEISK